MNHRLLLSLAAAAAVAAAPKLAAAQDAAPFGQRAPWVLTFHSIAGYANQHVNVDNSGSSTTGVTFIGPATDEKYGGFFAGASPLARLGLHRFLDGGLSVGAELHYSDISLGNQTWFAFAPRVGFAIPLGPTTAIWLRGGITYLSQSVANGQISLYNWMPGGEALVVLTPTPHFGVTIGPFAEIGVSGKAKANVTSFSASGSSSTTYETDMKLSYYGISVGMLADF